MVALRITIVEARNLVVSGDVSTDAESSIHTVAILGKKKFRTKDVNTSQSPHWSESYEFDSLDPNDPEQQTIELQVFRSDTAGKEEVIGISALLLSELQSERENELWLPLDNGEHGEVLVKLTRVVHGFDDGEQPQNERDIQSVMDAQDALKPDNATIGVLQDVHIDEYPMNARCKRHKSPYKTAPSRSPKKAEQLRLKKEKRQLQMRERGFDVRSNEHISIPKYNSLMDPNLAVYFQNPSVRRSLQSTCMIDRRGNILDVDGQRQALTIAEQELKRRDAERRRKETYLKDRRQLKESKRRFMEENKKKIERSKAIASSPVKSRNFSSQPDA